MTHLRKIRSFVRREGRMTNAQRRAMEELMPVHGITDTGHVLDLDAIFGRSAPRYLEIGFGMGDSLLQMASRHPESDYIGIDVHRPGVGGLLLRIEELGIHNLKLINDDAVEILQRAIADQGLDGVFLFFPDPWHKKKHHKRRIVQPDFVQLVRRKLKMDGIFHLATDWENYAEHMMENLSQAEGFENLAGTGQYSSPGERPETKYERRGQRLGHGVWDLRFRRIK